jgi:hypothetical protein
MLGLTIGVGGLLNSILNLLRSKDVNDLNPNSQSLFGKLHEGITIDKKISMPERFNYLIILLFGVLLSVIIYRIMQFSILIPLKTMLNSLGYIFLGFNITDYVDGITDVYLPLIKQ